MTIKRTQSQNFNDRMEEVSRQDRSTHSISIANRSKRVPEFMQNTLRGIMSSVMANNPLLVPEAGMKQSAVGNALKSKIKSTVNFIKSIKNCEICEGEIAKPKNKNLQVYMCDCEHKFNFCQSCLHHYVIYKVKNFEEVMCPRDGCPASLDMDTNFFKGLPADIQKNYKKVHQFYLTSKNPDLRLCPKQNCEGLMKKQGQNVMVCNECHSKFCGKCLLAVHSGDCDNEQVKFFQGNLHYRQCKKCKFIIEKNQGCNHITCKCGYQFCYVCGEKWAPVHYGNHDENGRVIPVPEPGQRQAAVNLQRYQQPDGCCAECGCDCNCCQCTDLEDCCGQTCVKILKCPLRLFLLMLFLTFMVLLFVVRDLLLTICIFFMSILAGMTGFSCEFLTELQNGWFILGILFFPIIMVAGIVRGFREIFCDIMPEMYNQFGSALCNGLADICD